MGRTLPAYPLTSATPICQPGVSAAADRLARAQWTMADYEFRQLCLPRGTSRTSAWRLLTEQAEHHGWELDRLRLYPDGTRRVRLRRRVLRVVRTL
jgi:hypothetical protein